MDEEMMRPSHIGHGHRSVGGQGDMSPLLFEVVRTSCVLFPPYFSELDFVM